MKMKVYTEIYDNCKNAKHERQKVLPAKRQAAIDAKNKAYQEELAAEAETYSKYPEQRHFPKGSCRPCSSTPDSSEVIRYIYHPQMHISTKSRRLAQENGLHYCRVCRASHGADFERLAVVISNSTGMDDNARATSTRHFDLDLALEASLEQTYLQLQKYKNYPVPIDFLIIAPGLHDLTRHIPAEPVIIDTHEMLTGWNLMNMVAFSRLPYPQYLSKILHRFQSKGDKHFP